MKKQMFKLFYKIKYKLLISNPIQEYEYLP